MNLRLASWLTFSSLAVWAAGCSGEEFSAANNDGSTGASVGGSSTSTGATATMTTTTTGAGGSSQSASSVGVGGSAGSSRTSGGGSTDSGGTAGSKGTGGGSGTGAGGAAGTSGTGGANTVGVGGSGGRPDGGMAGNAGAGGGAVDGGKMDSSVCPTAQPSSGSACASEGLSCRYGACCPATATCSGGKWLVALPPCAAPMCPQQAPANGSGCECFTNLSCHYDTCSQNQLQTDAKCMNNAWSVQTYGCENACGVEDCTGGQICLVRSGSQHCVANPCLPQPLSCGCATSLCPTGCSVTSAVLTCP